MVFPMRRVQEFLLELLEVLPTHWRRQSRWLTEKLALLMLKHLAAAKAENASVAAAVQAAASKDTSKAAQSDESKSNVTWEKSASESAKHWCKAFIANLNESEAKKYHEIEALSHHNEVQAVLQYEEKYATAATKYAKHLSKQAAAKAVHAVKEEQAASKSLEAGKFSDCLYLQSFACIFWAVQALSSALIRHTVTLSLKDRNALHFTHPTIGLHLVMVPFNTNTTANLLSRLQRLWLLRLQAPNKLLWLHLHQLAVLLKLLPLFLLLQFIGARPADAVSPIAAVQQKKKRRSCPCCYQVPVAAAAPEEFSNSSK
jgi:hypothetical protein